MVDTAPSSATGAQPLVVPRRRRLPLAGVRIADLTAVWAGPYATRLLADMGAEVIKVESAGAPDLLRALAGPMPGVERTYNRSAYFNHNNRNKYGCSIDLATPAGKQLFLELVSISDVVIENFRADVLDRLGLGYEVLRGIRPDIVLVSMPGHGKTGPEAGYIAYGTNVEQLAGLVSITGYEGGEPHKSGISYGDPIAGTMAAGAVLTALLYRRRTGRGQWVDLAQREALTGLLGEYVVHYSMTRRLPERTGNSHPAWAPHGVFPCAGPGERVDADQASASRTSTGGPWRSDANSATRSPQGRASQTSDDRWVAIAVRDDAEFAALCRTIGRPELASDPRFADGLSRHRNRAELDAPISAWTATRTNFAAAEELQSAGVPAAPVESYTQLLDEDQHLRARGFFEEVTHREAGTWRMEAPVWRFDAAPAHIRINAPSFAEHNEFVFGDLLGLDAALRQELERASITAREPDLSQHRQ